MKRSGTCHGIFKSALSSRFWPHEIHNNFSRYFAQRYSIFSKYDEGIWMTDDAWFGVTPEPVAEYDLMARL